METFTEYWTPERLKCTVCGESNLDEMLCFNCKGMGECLNCCGCEDWCDKCEVHEVHLSDIDCLAYEQEREGK